MQQGSSGTKGGCTAAGSAVCAPDLLLLSAGKSLQASYEEPLLGAVANPAAASGADAVLIPSSHSNSSLVTSTAAGKLLLLQSTGAAAQQQLNDTGSPMVGRVPSGRSAGGGAASASGVWAAGLLVELLCTPAVRCLVLDRAALRQCRPTLRAM